MDTPLATLLEARDYRAALTCLTRDHGAALGRYCIAAVGSAAEGEELLQETLLAALDGLPTYRGEAAPRAWLFGVARKVCHQHLRKRSRRAGLLARWWGVGGGEGAEASDRGQRQSDARLTLAAALSSLRPTLRQPVLLRYQQGFDAAEVAGILGISHGAARKRISLGIQALRRTLAETLTEKHHDTQILTPLDDALSAPGRVRIVGS